MEPATAIKPLSSCPRCSKALYGDSNVLYSCGHESCTVDNPESHPKRCQDCMLIKDLDLTSTGTGTGRQAADGDDRVQVQTSFSPSHEFQPPACQECGKRATGNNLKENETRTAIFYCGHEPSILDKESNSSHGVCKTCLCWKCFAAGYSADTKPASITKECPGSGSPADGQTSKHNFEIKCDLGVLVDYRFAEKGAFNVTSTTSTGEHPGKTYKFLRAETPSI